MAVVRPGHCPDTLNFEQEIEIVECDMGEYGKLPALIGKKRRAVFYHLAWAGIVGPSRSDPSVQLQNVKAAGEAVQTAAKIGCSHFVGVGSMREYEGIAELDGDTATVSPSCIYGEGKHFARFYTKALSAQLGLKHTWAILSNVYGEDPSLRFIINTTLYKILHQEPLEFTAGTQLYDFIHVEDAARALVAIGESGVPGSSYVVGNGQPRPLREYLGQMGRLFAPEREMHFGSIPYTGISLHKECFSIEKLTKDTGFIPQISFEEGIKRTMEWLKAQEEEHAEI